MKRTILGLAAVVCAGCMSPHEHEVAHVGQLELEGMAWAIDCETTQAKLDRRRDDEIRTLDHDRMCTLGDPLAVGFGRDECETQKLAVQKAHYWASRELKTKCGRR